MNRYDAELIAGMVGWTLIGLFATFVVFPVCMVLAPAARVWKWLA